jgi:hypothetical protein
VSRLLNLAVLLHASAQEDDLKAVIAQLRGASTALPTRYTIARSIARLMEHEDAK